MFAASLFSFEFSLIIYFISHSHSIRDKCIFVCFYLFIYSSFSVSCFRFFGVFAIEQIQIMNLHEYFVTKCMPTNEVLENFYEFRISRFSQIRFCLLNFLLSVCLGLMNQNGSEWNPKPKRKKKNMRKREK